MKYSIIIPTLGRESLKTVLKGISECEGFKNIKPEILVIFDGRPVDTKLSKYIKGLRLYATDHQVYAGGARNVGIEKSIGNILIFIGDNGIPDKDWLKQIVEFHEKNKSPNRGLLGKVIWKCQTDFTQFLENGPQFDYSKIKKNGADWRHFYTSNISLKKSFLKIGKGKKGSEELMLKFDNNFKGWGFEDAEFGYRLAQKGFKLSYNERSIIYRLDVPDLDSVLLKTLSARKNALVFEQLHPEIKILPRGGKRIVLKVLIFIASVLGIFFPKMKWWAKWKTSWVGK